MAKIRGQAWIRQFDLMTSLFSHSFPSELETGPKAQISSVFVGRGSVVTSMASPGGPLGELALASPLAVGCESLTSLEAIPLTLPRAPGLYEVTRCKKLHFKGKKKKEVSQRTNEFIFVQQLKKTNIFSLKSWKDSKLSNSRITASTNITRSRMRILDEFSR